jgi:hypothetical protein
VRPVQNVFQKLSRTEQSREGAGCLPVLCLPILPRLFTINCTCSKLAWPLLLYNFPAHSTALIVVAFCTTRRLAVLPYIYVSCIASFARCDVFTVFCIGHLLRVKPHHYIVVQTFDLYHGLINCKDTKAKGRNL